MKKVSLLIALFALTQMSIAQKAIGYNLSVGDEYRIIQNAKQKIVQTIPGGEQVINNDISSIYLFEVTNITDDLYTIDLSFKQFGMKMSSPQYGTMMDINTDTDNEESAVFKNMLDKPVTITMKKTGQITDVQNGYVLIDAIANGMGLTDPEAIMGMRKEMEGDWSPEALTQSFQQMTYVYPTEKVKEGDTWENEYGGVSKVQAQNSWTLAEMTADSQQLTATAPIKMNLTNASIEMKLQGNQTTTFVADAATGFPQELRVESTASGDATVPQMPGTTIPTTVTMTTTYIRQ